MKRDVLCATELPEACEGIQDIQAVDALPSRTSPDLPRAAVSVDGAVDSGVHFKEPDTGNTDDYPNIGNRRVYARIGTSDSNKHPRMIGISGGMASYCRFEVCALFRVLTRAVWAVFFVVFTVFIKPSHKSL